MFTQVRRRGDQGAVAVFTALLLPIIFTVAAIVVDIGMQRVTRTDLQALADVVALDLAREIHGSRTQADLAPEGDFSNPTSAVRRSVARNTHVLGNNLKVQVDWGSWDGTTWNTATDPPTAVEVTATAETDYALTSGTGPTKRRAYATASNSACFRLGTFTAAVNSGDSTVLTPLNYLMNVNLTLVSYQALAKAKVSLSEIAAASVIGSPTKLLTGTISYGSLILATIDALQKQSGSNAAAISALQTLYGASGPVGSVSLGSVFHVSPTDDAALAMKLSVLDVIGSARLANGNHFIEVDNLQSGVPGVGYQFSGGLKLISAAQLACGRPNSATSVAKNAQLSGTLGIDFANIPSLSVTGVGTLQTAKAVGSLAVNLADGQGALVEPPAMHCGSSTASDPSTFSVSVQTTPASYKLTADLDMSGNAQITDLLTLGLTNSVLTNLLGLPLPAKTTLDVHVTFTAGTTSAGGSSIANLSLPPNDVTPIHTGSNVYLDPNTIVPTITSVKLGGKTATLSQVTPLTNAIMTALGTSNQFVQKTLVPLVDSFNTQLVGPVARMVGLRFSGADVYAVGSVCGLPALRG